MDREGGKLQIDQFRIISLLCVEAKIFFSIVSRRLSIYVTNNTYIDTSVHFTILYYNRFSMRVSSGSFSWHKVQIGIITRCTISVILFSLAMNMLIKSAEPECRGPRMRSTQRQPPIRAFMDDLTITIESVPGCR